MWGWTAAASGAEPLEDVNPTYVGMDRPAARNWA